MASGAVAARTPRSIPVFGSVVGLIVVGMAILVIYPVIRLFYSVFFLAGDLNTAEIVKTVSDPNFLPMLRNTGLLIAVAGGAALAIGSVLAWLNERTDARMGWAADLLPIIPIVVPTVAVALGWMFLFTPTAGFVNAFFNSFDPAAGPFAQGPVKLYSAGGLAAVVTLLAVPYVYLVMSAALRNVDSAYEEASRMSGVGPLGTFGKITLPAVRNALATAAVLLFLTIMGMFVAPALIGIPAKIDVLSIVIFRLLYVASPPGLGEAIVLSSLMFVAAQLAVLVEYAITRSGHHATVGGRGQASSRTSLGIWRWPARVTVLLYLASTTVLPGAALILVSLQGFWTSDVDWSKLSLSNYLNLFSVQGTFRQALTNSLGLSVASATALMVMAALIAVFIQRAPSSVARVTNLVATLPATVPHTVVAMAFLITLGVGDFNIRGTLLILFLAYLVLYLPTASRTAGAALSQIGKDMWESSLMSGASQLRTFGLVILPLMLAGLVAGWVIVFAHVLGEASAGVFLSSQSANPVVGPVVIQFFQNNAGSHNELAALAVITTTIQASVVLLVLVLTRRKLT